jgi:uncharacterized protein YndB with AHSA1/START domain
VDFTESVDIAIDPDTVFAYVGNPEKLPHYLERAVAAHRTRGDSVQVECEGPPGQPSPPHDAWLRVRPGRELEWGVHGGSYSGEAAVIASDRGSILVVTLRIADADFTSVNHQLRESLERIKHTLEGGAR